MAIRKDIKLNDTRTGIAYPAAYIRIASCHISERDQAIITLHYWTTRAVYLSKQFVPWKVDTSYVMENFDQNSNLNLKAQIYQWLRTQPEFISAEDI